MAFDQKYLEQICRQFCHLSGKNPDELVDSDTRINTGDVAWSEPRWQTYRSYAEKLILMTTAIDNVQRGISLEHHISSLNTKPITEPVITTAGAKLVSETASGWKEESLYSASVIQQMVIRACSLTGISYENALRLRSYLPAADNSPEYPVQDYSALRQLLAQKAPLLGNLSTPDERSARLQEHMRQQFQFRQLMTPDIARQMLFEIDTLKEVSYTFKSETCDNPWVPALKAIFKPEKAEKIDQLDQGEAFFVLQTYFHPGSKEVGLSNTQNRAAELPPVWSKPNLLGLIEPIGSYKWKCVLE